MVGDTEKALTREDLDAVLVHLPRLRKQVEERKRHADAEDYKYSSEFSSAVRDVVKVFFDRGFIYQFDYQPWMEEATRFEENPELLSKVDLSTLRKLLVVHWRRDYWDWNNEHWEWIAAKGHLVALLERIGQIAEEMEPAGKAAHTTASSQAPIEGAGDNGAWPTADELTAGFEKILDKMTPQQMIMLEVNYHSGGRAATMRELAKASGYRDYKIANIQYGGLAKRLYTAMGYPAPKSSDGKKTFWILGLGEFVDRREYGLEMQCVMRPEVAAALERLGIVEADVRVEMSADEDDIDYDDYALDRLIGTDSEDDDYESSADEFDDETEDEDDSGGGALSLANCSAFDILEDLGEELDLVHNAMGVAWRCWLHPDAYAVLKGASDSRDDIYEENGHEYVKVFDNLRIPFVIHMRIAGLDESLPTAYPGGLGNRREVDDEFPMPKAQSEALGAHGR